MSAIAHRSIMGAFVGTDDEDDRHAVIELWWYPGTTREQRLQGRRAALIAVLQYLGPEWSATVRDGDPRRVHQARDKAVREQKKRLG